MNYYLFFISLHIILESLASHIQTSVFQVIKSYIVNSYFFLRHPRMYCVILELLLQKGIPSKRNAIPK